MCLQALDSIFMSQQQTHGFCPQLPAVLLRTFRQAIRAPTISQEVSTAIPSVSCTEADAQAKGQAGFSPSADLHFFLHLLALVMKSMHAAHDNTAQQQIPLGSSSSSKAATGPPVLSDNSCTLDNLTSANGASQLSSEKAVGKAAGPKRKRSKSAGKESDAKVDAAATGVPALGAAARWTQLAATAASLLTAAQQLGVYRPNEDTTGSNRASLVQLASIISLHVTSVWDNDSVVGLLLSLPLGCPIIQM